MPQYRFRAAKRDEAGVPGDPMWDDIIDAPSLGEAITKARTYPVDRLIDNTDYAWLTDANGVTVWALKLEEVEDMDVLQSK